MKYDLKRAVVTLIEPGKYKSERDIQRQIKMYKAAIEALGMDINREESSDYLAFSREIKNLRRRCKKLRSKRQTFKVWVKAYRKEQLVDWDFQQNELGPQYRQAFKEMLKGVVDKAIQKCRIGSRTNTHPDMFAGQISEFMGHKKHGRVFTKDGEVLRIYVAKNIKSLYDDKKPTEPKKYIGIELEFCAPIKENQFAVKLFKSGIHKFAQLKKDASLRPHDNETGYELAILLEESNYKKRLKQITTILAEVGAVAIDRRAGLHVHIDMRRRNKDLVYNNLVSCQYALLSIVDPKRYNNEFCRVVDSRKFPTEFTGQREERYRTINAAAFYKYKTLEVRMHEGSVDFTQISNWVDILIRISNYSKKLKNDVSKVTTLSKRLNLDKKLYNYIQDRSCFWQVQNTDNARSLRDRLEELTPVRAARPSTPGPYVSATRSLFDAHMASMSNSTSPIFNIEYDSTTGGIGGNVIEEAELSPSFQDTPDEE